MIHAIKKGYLLFRILSLDVVIGTLMTGVYISKLLNVSPSGWWYLILASTVWIIYTIDHLLDGLKGKDGQPVIFRHRYHFKHKKVLLVILTGLSVFTLVTGLLFLDKDIVIAGLILFAIIFSFFLIFWFFQKNISFFNQKELFIAIAYVAGITLAPYYWANSSLSTHQIILILVMVMLAWAEGILASWFDYENDIHDGHRSFTTAFGRKNTRYFLITLHIVIFILLKINLLFTVNLFQFFAIIIEVLMNTSLLLMLMFPKSMKIYDRYRIFGEMVFWLPGLILLAG